MADGNLPPHHGTKHLDEELCELVGLIEYRPAVMAEGITQAPVFEDYFRGVLNYDRYSHPVTTRLVAVCLNAATSAVMRAKWHFQRPRPSQLSPALLPPIHAPPHASFPSGHSTQAHTLAHLFTAILGDLVKSKHKLHEDDSGVIRNPYFDMAERIARNREVLGLHYPSDSEAGKVLTEALFTKLGGDKENEIPGNPEFCEELEKAKAEWGVWTE